MNRTLRPVVFLSSLALLLATTNCECDNPQKLGQANARADRYFDGTKEQVPDPSEFQDTPSDGVISVDFGQTDLGSPNTRYLFIANTGQNDLVLSEVELTDDFSADFQVECFNGVYGACPSEIGDRIEVPQASHLRLRLVYAPVEIGADFSDVVLHLNARDHELITLKLKGQGVTPAIQVCASHCTGGQASPDCAQADELCSDLVAPNALEVPFGDTTTDQPLSRTIKVRNLGDRDLEVTGLGFTTGAWNQYRLNTQGSALPGVLPPGAERTFEVTYAPATGGDHTAFLQILSNDLVHREVKLMLTGRGLAPRLCPDPTLLDFGTIATGESAELAFTVKNCGLLDLALQRAALAPASSGDFSISSNPSPITLPPEATATVKVKYSPTAMGSDSGGVDLFSNDPTSNPQGLTGTIGLKGQSVPRACDIVTTPVAVQFGSVVKNQTQTAQLVVSNAGNDNCRVDSIAITLNSPDNEFAIVSAPPPGSAIAPGDSLFVDLRYAPIGVGQDTGTLSIFCDDRDTQEVRVDLNGIGISSAECDLVITPTSARFGVVKLNRNASQAISLTNNGMEVCHISQIELRNKALGDFALTKLPTLPLTLGRRGSPNANAEVEITFAPKRAGGHAATLWVTSDDPDLNIVGSPLCSMSAAPVNGQACLLVGGNSAESEIEVVPDELDFGVVTIGCNSPELHVTVYNLGATAINVTDIALQNEPDPNFEIRQTPRLPYVLNGGQNFQVNLRYHPQDKNIHRNNLIITSDASNVEELSVPLFGSGTDISTQTDVFHQATDVKADVLFTVDNSGSMGEEQNALATNFNSFISYALQLNVDYHIGVIATEVNTADRNQGTPPRDIIPGVLVQAPNRPKILTKNTPNLATAFAENVRLGICCSDEQEAGLQATWMALSDPKVSDPAANGGFLREDAKLYIICISDEQDQSKGDVDFYVDFFRSLKGYHNREMMKVSTICGPAAGCTGTSGTAESGSRYIDVANQTGGLVESICTDNWAQALENLGFDVFTPRREFYLTRQADPSTLVVRVNGRTIPRAQTAGGPTGWTYYSDYNSIFFGDSVIPDRGATIEISYTATCL